MKIKIMSKIYDVAIIGAGPAGLSAAIYVQRAGYNSIVFEANVHGGQIINTPEVENYPAIRSITGVEYAMNIYEQAVTFGAEVEYKGVTSVDFSSDIKKVYTGDEMYEAKTVIIATGVVRRPLDVVGEQQFLGKGVSYCATCDGAFFKDKVGMVIGGGNTALEDAVYLSSMCSKVYLVHRRDEFRGAKHEAEKVLKNEKIELVLDSVITGIYGDTKVNSVGIKNLKTNEEKTLDTSCVFIAVGLIAQNSMFEGIINLTTEGYINSGEDCKTNIAGVFTAGDTRNKTLRQLVTATADGAIAGTAACDYLSKL